MSDSPLADESQEQSFAPPLVSRRSWWLSTRGIIALWSIAIVLTVVVLFVADNFVLVEVRLMQQRIQARLAWVVVIAFLLGALIGGIVGRQSVERRVFRWIRGSHKQKS